MERFFRAVALAGNFYLSDLNDWEESTGHHDVIVYPVTEGDLTGERHVDGKHP